MGVDLSEADIRIEVKVIHRAGVYSTFGGLLPDNSSFRMMVDSSVVDIRLEAKTVHCDGASHIDSYRKDSPSFGMVSLPDRLPVEAKMVRCD